MKFSSVLFDFMTGRFKSLILKNPRYLSFGISMAKNQNMQAKKRDLFVGEGLNMPPTVILSVTQNCNLDCDGCYSKAHNRESNELSDSQLQSIANQACELGVSVVFLAGGEPFMRDTIFDMAASNPEVIFPVFTNGTLIDLYTIDKLKRHLNLIPVISIEGYEKETDCRRGDGTFTQILNVANILKSNGLLFGVSITATRENIEQITSSDFTEFVESIGANAAFYVEYVPIRKGTENLCLTSGQRDDLNRFIDSKQDDSRMLYVSLPGDEERYGGCLAAGNGFLHISSNGDLEPCPFAPLSDCNLKEMSLKEALESKLMKSIRENHNALKEGEGGCALWANNDMFAQLKESAK